MGEVKMNGVTLKRSGEYAVISKVVDDIQARENIGGQEADILADNIINQIVFIDGLTVNKKYDLLVAIANNLYSLDSEASKKVARAMKGKINKIADKEYENAMKDYDQNPIVFNKDRVRTTQGTKRRVREDLVVGKKAGQVDPSRQLTGVSRNQYLSEEDKQRAVDEKLNSALKALEANTTLSESKIQAAGRVHEAQNLQSIKDLELDRALKQAQTEYSEDESFIASDVVRQKVSDMRDDAYYKKVKSQMDQEVSQAQKEATIAITGDQQEINRKMHEAKLENLKLAEELNNAQIKFHSKRLVNEIKIIRLNTRVKNEKTKAEINEINQDAKVDKARIDAEESTKQYAAKLQDKTAELESNIRRAAEDRAYKEKVQATTHSYNILDLDEKLRERNQRRLDDNIQKDIERAARNKDLKIQKEADSKVLAYEQATRVSNAEMNYEWNKNYNARVIDNQEAQTKITKLKNEESVNTQQTQTTLTKLKNADAIDKQESENRYNKNSRVLDFNAMVERRQAAILKEKNAAALDNNEMVARRQAQINSINSYSISRPLTTSSSTSVRPSTSIVRPSTTSSRVGARPVTSPATKNAAISKYSGAKKPQPKASSGAKSVKSLGNTSSLGVKRASSTTMKKAIPSGVSVVAKSGSFAPAISKEAVQRLAQNWDSDRKKRIVLKVDGEIILEEKGA